MTQVEIFKFDKQNGDQTTEIRMQLDADGNPWFLGADAAAALDYKDTDQAIRDNIDPEDKQQMNTPSGGRGNPNRWWINESGLYSLIFASKKPVAKKFKRWVTSDVLPSIRTKGGYISPHATLSQRQQLMNEISMDLEIVELAKNVAPSDWLAGQIARILNRGLTGDSRMPLTGPKLRVTCREYLLNRGLSLTQAKKVGAVFGGRVWDLYLKKYPGTNRAPSTEGELSASYEEDDWELFDQAWDYYYHDYFQPMGF